MGKQVARKPVGEHNHDLVERARYRLGLTRFHGIALFMPS